MPGSVPDVIAPTPQTVETINPQLMQVADAAFHSRGTWYDVSFHCEANDKTDAITNFRFSIGKAIPEDQRTRLGLPAQ